MTTQHTPDQEQPKRFRIENPLGWYGEEIRFLVFFIVAVLLLTLILYFIIPTK